MDPTRMNSNGNPFIPPIFFFSRPTHTNKDTPGQQGNNPSRAIDIPPLIEQHLSEQYRSLETTLCRLPVEVEARIRGSGTVHAELQDRTLRLEEAETRYEREKLRWRREILVASATQYQLCTELTKRTRALKEREEKFKSAEAELRNLHGELALRRARETQLRAVILDKTGEKVNDQEMRERFCKVRRMASGICRSLATRIKSDDVPPPTWMAEKKELWRRLTAEERVNRIRGRVFDVISVHAFEKRVYGIEGYLQVGKETDMAEAFAAFEKHLQSQKVDDSLISDWRISTMNGIDKMACQGQKHVAKTLSDLIKKWALAPYLDGLDEAKTDDLLARISNLSREAVELRMMMRRSRDNYAVEAPGLGGTRTSIVLCEELAEPVAVEGGKPSEASQDIAFAVFGALVKRPEDGNGEMVVLEKAEVILQKK